MKTQTPNIVLIFKSGGDFRFSDVYLLVTHINKYWVGQKPNIYCYTDAVTEEQKVVGLTIRPLPFREWQGWWSKMNLFAPSLRELRPFLYMDLDTAILNNISFVIPPEDELKINFITLRDFYKPNNLASGVMWIPNTGDMDKVFSEWKNNPIAIMRKFRGDQDFIGSVTKANLYWQDIFLNEQITTFKPNGVVRKFLPANSSIVCFHGEPRIPKAALTIEWVKKYTSYVI